MTRGYPIHRPTILRAQRRHRSRSRAVDRKVRAAVARSFESDRATRRRCARSRFRWEIALPVALGVYLIAQLVRAAIA